VPRGLLAAPLVAWVALALDAGGVAADESATQSAATTYELVPAKGSSRSRSTFAS